MDRLPIGEQVFWLACTERQRELDAHRSYDEVRASRAHWTISARAALELSDWLIASGESLRRHYEKAAPVSL